MATSICSVAMDSPRCPSHGYANAILCFIRPTTARSLARNVPRRARWTRDEIRSEWLKLRLIDIWPCGTPTFTGASTSILIIRYYSDQYTDLNIRRELGEEC